METLTLENMSETQYKDNIKQQYDLPNTDSEDEYDEPIYPEFDDCAV